MNKALLGSMVLVGLAVACGGSDTPVPTIETTTFSPSLGVVLAASTKTADGLYYRDLTTNPSGAVVAVGQKVTVKYSGALPNGFVFDRGDLPLTFTIGDSNFIKGFSEGVAGMHVGASRQLIIPPSLGYGATGKGSVPGNAIMVFSIQLQSIG